MKHFLFCLLNLLFAASLQLKADEVQLVRHNPSTEAPTALGGTGIDFFTNSSEIVVRMVPSVRHTKCTFDLYGTDRDGTLYDFSPAVIYGDTVTLRVAQLVYPNARKERGYNFHLSVADGWTCIDIATNADAAFGFDPMVERPIALVVSDDKQADTPLQQSLAYLLRRQTGHDIVTLRLGHKEITPPVSSLSTFPPLLYVAVGKRAMRYLKKNGITAYQANGDVPSQVEDIRRLLGEDSEQRCAFRPITQQRDPYDWLLRHRNVLKINTEEPPSVILIGNSITHYWAGLPTGRLIRGTDSWNDLWQDTIVHNLGFGWDRIENALWRINHGELDGYEAEKVLLLLGTNNIAYNTDEEIADGIVEVVRSVRVHQPTAQIFVCSVLPRIDHGERVEPLNEVIQKTLCTHKSPAIYLDLTPFAFDDKGHFRHELFSDGLHPNAEGYRMLAARLKQQLSEKTIPPAQTSRQKHEQ